MKDEMMDEITEEDKRNKETKIEEKELNAQMYSHINVLHSSLPTFATSTSKSSPASSHGLSCKSSTPTPEQLTDSECSGDDSIEWETDSTWPDVDIPGTWGTHGLERCPWEDDDKPSVTFRKFPEVELNENEQRGILTERIIATSSSYLDRSAEYQKYIFCKVDLSSKMLTDISILTYHHYLQYVNLRKNDLTQVEALGQLPFLMYLDVSFNFLTTLLDFKPPFNLTYVNYSNNRIQAIGDLSNFWSIVHLDISANRIDIIEGLQNLKYLRHLNLSKNIITCIENLSYMKLLTLNLNHNNITQFEEGEDVGFKTLIDILYIDVGNNYLSSLKLFQGASNVQSINVENNKIEDLMDLIYLNDLYFLTEAIFEGNPIFEKKLYIESCIFNIKHICLLDRMFLDASKKAAVMNNFNSFPYMDSIRKSADLLFLQQINDPMLGSFVVPFDYSPPPMIILVGPPGSQKGEITRNFVKSHPKFAILGVSHTTREMNTDETQGVNYHYVSHRDFMMMAGSGKFLTVSNSLGKNFGLAENELSKTVGHTSALVLHMDLTSALTLRAKGYSCQLVLAMPDTSEIHERWLMEKYYNHSLAPAYVGAVEIENFPRKAKQYLTHSKDYNTYSATCYAQEVVQDVINKATKEDDSSDTCSSDNKDNDSNSPAFGILKACSLIRSKSTLINLPRASVTFGKQPEEPCTRKQMTRVHSIRSVTFNENQSQLFFDQQQNSASQTVFNNSNCCVDEADSNVLSVLSHTHFHSNLIKCDSAAFSCWKTRVEATETLVDEVLKSRPLYLEVHQANPGLFTDVIFTNKPKDAHEKLKLLLKQCISNQRDVKPHFSFKKDSAYQIMLATRLLDLHKDIKSHMSVTQSQFRAMEKVTKKQTFVSDNRPSRRVVVEVMRKYHHEGLNYKLPGPTKSVRRSKDDSMDSYS